MWKTFKFMDENCIHPRDKNMEASVEIILCQCLEEENADYKKQQPSITWEWHKQK